MIEAFPVEAIYFIEHIGTQLTVAGVVDELARLTHRFGVEAITFCNLPNSQQDFADTLLAKKWPDEWFSEYTTKQYIRVDPMARVLKRTSRPFLWSDIHVDPEQDPLGAALMERRRDFGLNDAFVVPVHNPTGLPGFVCLSGPQLELPPRARLSMHLIAISAFERIRDIRPQIAKPLLTPREREVLTWVAHGKRAGEIGFVLNISRRTVHEHVQTAARKLNASTMSHAVAIAIKDGHIRL